jgi:hypothetical protein
MAVTNLRFVTSVLSTETEKIQPSTKKRVVFSYQTFANVLYKSELKAKKFSQNRETNFIAKFRLKIFPPNNKIRRLLFFKCRK